MIIKTLEAKTNLTVVLNSQNVSIFLMVKEIQKRIFVLFLLNILNTV